KLYEETDCTPELGAVKGFFITRAADEGVRKRAQHGGTVTTLVTLALREGLIDAAVLAGEGEGLLPRSVTITDAEVAAKMGKSRFVVSPTVAEFNRICRGDAAKIGVVATPCQAVALAKMRTQPVSEVENGIEKLHLVVGLFCGWALSWQKLAALLKAKTDLSQVTGMDIPPSRYHTLEVYTRGETIRVSLDEVNPCVREACRSLLEPGNRPDTTGNGSPGTGATPGRSRIPRAAGGESGKTEGGLTGKEKGGGELVVRATRFRRANRADRLSPGPDRRWRYPDFFCGRLRHRKGVSLVKEIRTKNI
ncbi:MAG: Coenzyme F420 hydrogenase/dehydrogenase, beta subunit C-terminal domain, partial [Deltaproteobacteria bacterium]|nr:Coenzyme F420 hydrogenase/dehydrogenase, beta subunit C-terminal domain [Deltaproteobacteria bacterium]